jgi:hypothetical protein
LVKPVDSGPIVVRAAYYRTLRELIEFKDSAGCIVYATRPAVIDWISRGSVAPPAAAQPIAEPT